MFEDLSYIARVGGLIYLLVLFIGVLAYVFWPRNKATFDRASRMPLDEEEQP